MEAECLCYRARGLDLRCLHARDRRQIGTGHLKNSAGVVHYDLKETPVFLVFLWNKNKQKKKILLWRQSHLLGRLSDRFYTCPRGKWFMFMSNVSQPTAFLQARSIAKLAPALQLLFCAFSSNMSGLFSPLMVTNSGLDCLSDKIGSLICVVKLPLRCRALFGRGPMVQVKWHSKHLPLFSLVIQAQVAPFFYLFFFAPLTPLTVTCRSRHASDSSRFYWSLRLIMKRVNHITCSICTCVSLLPEVCHVFLSLIVLGKSKRVRQKMISIQTSLSTFSLNALHLHVQSLFCQLSPVHL